VSEATSEPPSVELSPRGPEQRAVRAAVVGISAGTPCGVHEHATLLARSLEREGVSCSLHWLWRSDAPFAPSRSQVHGWIATLMQELRDERPDAVLLHYSVFAYSYRGVPAFVHPVLSALRRLRIPVVSLLHEYAYPWGRGGVRGRVWAISQRALLLDVMRVSSAVVVTTDFRADWLTTRAWLPRRPTVLAPVFSPLPAARVASAQTHERLTIGLFGYAHEGVDMALVLDALRLLQDRGVPAQLLLIGAPGRDAAAGRSWLAGARARGIVQPPVFSGLLGAQELADKLASCDVLLSADRIGPTSRRTTLASSLAAGRPVVALDGRRSWRELREAEAVLFVEPAAGSLADALAELHRDEDARAKLASRGREFALGPMGVERSTDVVGRLLHRLAGGVPLADPPR
jgi:glycosyltransferase involved in cell wall biosynthesis